MHVTSFVIHRSSSSTHWREQNLSVCEQIVKYNKMSYVNSFIETKNHAPSGIRTHGPNNQAATELRVKPHGHWIDPMYIYSELKCKINC